jgi:hypothetical protein
MYDTIDLAYAQAHVLIIKLALCVGGLFAMFKLFTHALHEQSKIDKVDIDKSK